MKVFSHKWLHLEFLFVSTRGAKAVFLDAAITSTGSNVSEIEVAQIESSDASQDAAPEITVF
jgi:hypothetical protein